MPSDPGRTPDDPETTPGGSKILRHKPKDQDDNVAYLSETEMEAIEGFLAKFFGPNENVMHELFSEGIHLDLVPIPASADRPFHIISTMGMSARPMSVPEDSGLPRFAELLIALPPEWPLDEEALETDEHFWPLGWLKLLARMPSDYDTFLAPGHTIPNGDPPEPLPGCGFVGFLVLPVMLIEDEAELTIGDKTIVFFQVIPLFAEEMQLKLDAGVDALLERFEEAELPPEALFDPQRPNVGLP